MKIGYARVSTDKQTLHQQVTALKAHGCVKVYSDKAMSGRSSDRPGLRRARAALQRGSTLVVWSFDRAFRSSRDAINFIDDLHKNGIGFESLTQAIDTTTPEGEMWFTIIAAWAQYESVMISRRTREKMAAAKRRGKHLGRRFKLSERTVRIAHRRVTQDRVPIVRAARDLNASYDTLARAFRRLGLPA